MLNAQTWQARCAALAKHAQSPVQSCGARTGSDGIHTCRLADQPGMLAAVAKAWELFLGPRTEIVQLSSSGLPYLLHPPWSDTNACRLADQPGTLAAENAGEVLAAVAKARACPLTAQLSTPPMLRRLLAVGLESSHGTTLVQVITRLIHAYGYV